MPNTGRAHFSSKWELTTITCIGSIRQMAKKVSRSDVLSLRLNEARLAVLERYQEALSRQLKRQVSLAEAAVLVLEDRIERLEQTIDYGELASTPTASLARIRSRWASEHDLSAAEWRFLAEYVHVGAEEARQAQLRQRPGVPSRETYLALLDAFEAVYRERSEPESRHAWAYFDNLGGHHTGQTLSPTDAEQRHKAVLQLIATRRSQLADPQTPIEHAGYVGRCFVLAVRDEGVSGHMLNRILAPYWSTLWGLAARGHWFRHDRRPVRLTGAPDGDLRRGLPMPPKQTEGDLSLSFVSMAGLEIAARIEVAAGARRAAFYVRTLSGPGGVPRHAGQRARWRVARSGHRHGCRGPSDRRTLAVDRRHRRSRALAGRLDIAARPLSSRLGHGGNAMVAARPA